MLGIKDSQVRLGIEAPKEIPVHRSEVYERIKKGTEADARDGDSPAP